MARLVGEDPCFSRVLESLPSFAATDATVLITGETGTGKELIARAIHYLSPRRSFPFVAVNCGALADSLLEDELFGHARGAFTDARNARDGLVAEAARGTLFLDELSSLSLRAQAALLRVLQEKTYRRLGGKGEQRADVRFVAATNVPLEDMVRAGTLRADLYYRISVLSLTIPPLRERRADILPLARHFLRKHGLRAGGCSRLSHDAECALLTYDWPGNVRELENAIIRGISLGAGDEMACDVLGIPGIRATPQHEPLRTLKELKHQVIAAFEHDYLVRLMSQHRGNVSRAAATAGKERRELGKLLKKYRLSASDFVTEV